MCQACETRFYDLARERIVCPSCGEEYTAAARPVIDVAAHVAAPTGKTGWRRKVVKQSKPALPASDQEDPLPETSSDEADEAPETGPDDDLVLEQEPDDADVSGLIEHAEEPKEP